MSTRVSVAHKKMLLHTSSKEEDADVVDRFGSRELETRVRVVDLLEVRL